MLRITMVMCCFVLLSGCAPTQPPSFISPTPTYSEKAYAPRSGDQALSRSKFFLDRQNTSILSMESQPVQFAVDLRGSLPTPCHQARVVVRPPDSDNRIMIEAYSVVDPNRICAAMIQAFEGNIPLGSFPKGHYSIWVNGEKIGEIDT